MSGPVGSTPLVKKLRLEPTFRCLTIDAPTNFFSLLENLPPGLQFETEFAGEYDWAMLFVTQTQQVIEAIPVIVPFLVHDGLLWVTFPKSSSKLKGDLTREALWNVMHSHGYKAVTHVYVDQDWTAMRFRMLDLIGK
jgi:hypothetical protein